MKIEIDETRACRYVAQTFIVFFLFPYWNRDLFDGTGVGPITVLLPDVDLDAPEYYSSRYGNDTYLPGSSGYEELEKIRIVIILFVRLLPLLLLLAYEVLLIAIHYVSYVVQLLFYRFKYYNGKVEGIKPKPIALIENPVIQLHEQKLCLVGQLNGQTFAVEAPRGFLADALAYSTAGSQMRKESILPASLLAPVERFSSKGICAFKVGDEIVGMGFRAGDYLVTAAHVLVSAESHATLHNTKIEIVVGDKSYNFDTNWNVARFDKLDIIAIQCGTVFFSVAGMSKLKFAYPRPREQVVLQGYHNGIPSRAVGNVEERKDAAHRTFYHTASTTLGWSGTPLINVSNKVVGIHIQGGKDRNAAVVPQLSDFEALFDLDESPQVNDYLYDDRKLTQIEREQEHEIQRAERKERRDEAEREHTRQVRDPHLGNFDETSSSSSEDEEELKRKAAKDARRVTYGKMQKLVQQKEDWADANDEDLYESYKRTLVKRFTERFVRESSDGKDFQLGEVETAPKQVQHQQTGLVMASKSAPTSLPPKVQSTPTSNITAEYTHYRTIEEEFENLPVQLREKLILSLQSKLTPNSGPMDGQKPVVSSAVSSHIVPNEQKPKRRRPKKKSVQQLTGSAIATPTPHP